MKRKVFVLALAATVAAAALTSCNNNDSEPVYYYYKSLATVSNPDESAFFNFTTDKGTEMKVGQTYFRGYRPKTDQRIIAYYDLLEKAPANASYDYLVSLFDVYEVLTKDVVVITADNESELTQIGNDPYAAVNMWVSNNWLNVRFNLWAYNRAHFINLIEDTRTTYTDGKLHLQLRQNANGDADVRLMWGMASFNLAPFKEAGKTEIPIVVSVNLNGQSQPVEYELTYKFDDPAPDNLNIDMDQEQAQIE